MNFNLHENNYRMVFTIPIGKLDTADAKKALSEMIANYKYNIDLYTRKEKIEKILNKINK